MQSDLTLQTIREHILRDMTRVIVVVGGLALCAATVDQVRAGSYGVLGFYFLLYGVIITVAVWTTLPYMLRSGVALALMLAGAISEFYFYTLTDLSYIFLASFVLFTGLFYGLRPGLAALALSVVVLAIEYLKLRMEFAERTGSEFLILDNVFSWLSPTVTYGFLVASMLVAQMYMLRNLESSNESTRGLVSDLKDEIAERGKAEQALRESEARYRLLAENAQDVIWTSDLEGNVTYVSPSVTRVTGYTPEEYCSVQFGKGWEGAHAENAGRAIRGQLKRDESRSHVPGGRPFISLGQKRHKDGTLIDLEISTTFIRDEDGTPTGLLGVTRDVRDRKRLERQLYQAQKMEAVGQLAGGISHDFNNLLQVIHVYTEMALDEADGTPEMSRKLGHVLEASERVRDLVSQLLAFSRQQVLKLDYLNPGAVVVDLSAMIERLIGANFQIVRDIDLSLDHVHADRGQLEQVVMNLCVNSRDAMGKEGELTLRVGSASFGESDAAEKPWSKPGDYAVITVADNGSGMDEATKQRIFEPFYTTKAQGKGTGLGLSTVFGIVDQHGGFIHVDTEPGRGTAVNVYLPFAQKSERREEDTTAAHAEGGSETILFVDDEDNVRDIGALMLSKAGYTVIPASDGEEALEIIDERGDEIDLVMLDVVMPRLGGRATAERLANDPRQFPVIFMSGYAGEAVHDELRLDDGEKFIKKPYNRSTLLRTVRHRLDDDSATVGEIESV